MTAAPITMNYSYTVDFFWKGAKRNVNASCPHLPENELNASGLALLAIKSWFEKEGISAPEIVRNVDLVANERSYHWNTLIL